MTDAVFHLRHLPEFKQLIAIAQQSHAAATDAIVPSWDSVPAPIPSLVNRAQAEQFARFLFEGMTGFVNLRAVKQEADKPGPQVKEFWPSIDESLPNAVGEYCAWCADNGYAAFIVPFAVAERTSNEKGLLQTRIIVVDLDDCNVSEGIRILTAAIGEPALVVHSGGTNKLGQAKAHVYFQLSDDAGREALGELKRIRLAAAVISGGDQTVAKNVGQPLRIPGSKHHKPDQAPAACNLISIKEGGALTIEQLARSLGLNAEPKPDGLDFNDDLKHSDVARVLTAPIHEGAVDDITRYAGAGQAIGHYIRNMRDPATVWCEDEARQAARDWNAATLRPPWDEARLMNDFDRLLRRDIEANGPMPATDAPVLPTSNIFRLSDWSMEHYAGKAPEQRWLVDHVFPLGEAGTINGDGGIGKSFAALDLCFRVASEKRAGAKQLDFSGSETFGGEVMETGSAVFITAEESKAALHRRLEALDPYQRRAALGDRLSVASLRDVGGGRSLIGSKNKGYPMTDYARTLLAQLKSKPDLRLAIIDPLSVFYGAEGNDRTAVQAFADVLNYMASQTGATIIALHHMRKDSEGGSSGRKNILGSGGFVDAFRFAYTLQNIPKKGSAKYASDYGLADDHGELVVGELVKANGSAAGFEHIYERQPNGILRQLPKRIDIAKAEHERRRTLLVQAVDWYAEYGQPFTKTSRDGGAGLHHNRHALPEDLRGITQRQLEALAEEAVETGELQVAASGKEKRQQWLCKTGGGVAMGLLRDFTPGARPAWEARHLL